MSNKETQDMTGLGTHINLPERPYDPEPERYYDWMLWKLRQDKDWKKAMEEEISIKPKFNLLEKLLGGNSFTLAVIYTLGHIVIAMNVVYWMTGASLWEAGTVALVEPMINGLWFFILHSLWKRYNS